MNTLDTQEYRNAMGQLLVLYTQIDQLIMEICAERIASAPDTAAKQALAKQVGDEQRHVAIQTEWIECFGVDHQPVLSTSQEETIRNHFRTLPWLDFLADLYITVEALGGKAVEELVPLADPGTRASLHVPLQDELDHVAFGLTRLSADLAHLPPNERQAFITALPVRIQQLTQAWHGLCPRLPALFGAVGANYATVCTALETRRDAIFADLILAHAA